jgi:hypothetical protein
MATKHAEAEFLAEATIRLHTQRSSPLSDYLQGGSSSQAHIRSPLSSPHLSYCSVLARYENDLRLAKSYQRAAPRS